MSKTVFATVVLLCSHVAWGDSFTPEQLKDGEVKPGPGIATAKITGKPSWCDVVGKFDNMPSTSFLYNFNSGSGRGIKPVVEAAHDICANPSDPTWRQVAQNIVQQWMNWTSQSQADAEKSLRARVQTDKWKAQHDDLCKALDVSPEAAAEVKTFGTARLSLFGCMDQDQALWQDTGYSKPDVEYYLDSDLQTDPLMRVYWLYTTIPGFKNDLPSKHPADNDALLVYAAAAPDFAKVDRGELDKMMQAAPYNDYARAVLNETVSDLMAKRALYDAAIDKLAKGDDDYTTILRKAPQQAYADWDKLAAAWKPELEHSEAFEKLWSAPSRKAMKGCSTQLLKDAEKVTKQFKDVKDVTYKDMTSKLKADPIANVLFARLWVCLAVDKVPGLAGAAHEVAKQGRGVRGPRTLAEYAIVDAYAAVAGDRPRMVVSLSNFRPGATLAPDFDEHDFDYGGSMGIEGDRDWTRQGIVASTKKTAEGTSVQWKKTGYKFQNYECSDTKKPERIDDSGRIIYQQVCHNLPGTKSVDTTPSPLMIPSVLDGAVKPGVFLMVKIEGLDKQAKTGEQLAVPMYTKKAPTDQKITSWYGLPLQ